jgi:FHS family L-fucose permease-like MFS transporter
MEPRNTRLAILLVTGLFFLWALAHNLNPILIPHLRRALQLNDMRSALVDSAFFIAYFVMALPAGALMKRFGYRTWHRGRTAALRLGCLPLLASGDAAFLSLFPERALRDRQRPYFPGDGRESRTSASWATRPRHHRRINFAQAFNGLGAALAAFFGGRFILQRRTTLTDAKR